MSTKKKNKPKKQTAKKSFAAVDAIVKFEAAWTAKVGELINKHNDLAAQQAATEGMFKQLVSSIATELGKVQSTLENHMQALSGLDLNILASAEVLKELTAQISVILTWMPKFGPYTVDDAEIAEAKTKSEDWFKTMVSGAFTTVRTRLELEAQQQRDAMLRAKEEAEKKTESQAIEQELKNAENVERTVVASNSGGPGSDYPDGAELFGG